MEYLRQPVSLLRKDLHNWMPLLLVFQTVDDMYALADEITGPLRTVKRGQHWSRLQQWRQVAKLFVVLKHCRYLNELERCLEERSSVNCTDTAHLRDNTDKLYGKEFVTWHQKYRITEDLKCNFWRRTVAYSFEEMVPSLDTKTAAE
jgi:hypothetical protein